MEQMDKGCKQFVFIFCIPIDVLLNKFLLGHEMIYTCEQLAYCLEERIKKELSIDGGSIN